MTVKKGDKIKVEYTGKFEDGTVFDASEKHGEPLEFEVGAKQVVKGFDEAVVGMEVGEEKEIKIEPENGYGQRDDKMVRLVPRDKLPSDQEVKPGMMIGVQLPNGQQVGAIVVGVNEDSVTIDLNHPLAGKTLIFQVKIVGIN